MRWFGRGTARFARCGNASIRDVHDRVHEPAYVPRCQMAQKSQGLSPGVALLRPYKGMCSDSIGRRCQALLPDMACHAPTKNKITRHSERSSPNVCFQSFRILERLAGARSRRTSLRVNPSPTVTPKRDPPAQNMGPQDDGHVKASAARRCGRGVALLRPVRQCKYSPLARLRA
jgi:hypothetical protein